MGCVYDKYKKYPERGAYVWIKYKEPSGREKRRPIGRVKIEGLTKREYEREKTKLWKLAQTILTKVEGDIVAGRYDLDRKDVARTEPPFKDLADPWVEARKDTHRSARHDIGRMRNHLIPFFGEYRLAEIDAALVKKYIGQKRGALGGGGLDRTLALLSRFFNEKIEEGAPIVNPVSRLDRQTRRLARSQHDPKRTPFLRSKDAIRQVYMGFPEASVAAPYRVMFAVGVFTGLRTMEIPALDWQRDIDLDRRRITVHWQVKDGALEVPKDGEARIVPLLDTLFSVLAQWRMLTGGQGLCFPPHPTRGGRPGRPPRFRRPHAMHDQLDKALENAHLSSSLTWYQCTRHTFASHWVMDGRPIEKLKEILGHSTVQVTERYAHLAPDMYCKEDYSALNVDLSTAKVLRLEDARAQDGFPIGASASDGGKKTQ